MNHGVKEPGGKLTTTMMTTTILVMDPECNVHINNDGMFLGQLFNFLFKGDRFIVFFEQFFVFRKDFDFKLGGVKNTENAFYQKKEISLALNADKISNVSKCLLFIVKADLPPLLLSFPLYYSCCIEFCEHCFIIIDIL